jgi:hypothetical protein
MLSPNLTYSVLIMHGYKPTPVKGWKQEYAILNYLCNK